MIDPAPPQPPPPRVETQRAGDGYPIHVAVWPATAPGPVRGRLVVLHGVQSHGGWYHGLGATLAGAGYEAQFPDRRGSGANAFDRGHTPSAGRLIDDVAERLRSLRDADPTTPLTLAGISWGGKVAVITAADHPDLVDALALICPGLRPRVGVSTMDKIKITLAYAFNRRRTFPLPLGDPELFTDSPEGRRFIAADPLGLAAATAGLLAASTFIDRKVRRVLPRVRQPGLLMLAGRDRIIDNAKVRADFARLGSRSRRVIDYPEAHHTLEFEADPTRYARDLAGWLDTLARPNPASVRSV